MDGYQINEIIDSAISNLTKIAEVNTIVGKPLVAFDGTTILPVSQLTFAYMAGGGEYGKKANPTKDNANQFAGGSGGGATITPVGFLVVDKSGVRMIGTEQESKIDKLLDIAKGVFDNDKK